MQTLERNRLIQQYLPYTGAIATAFISELDLHGVVAYDDIIGYANLGLTQAAERFCPERGAHFKTFSFPHIRGAVIDGLRVLHRGRTHHQQWKAAKNRSADQSAAVPSRARRQPDQCSVEEAADAVVDPFPALDRILLRADIKKALDRLPEIERQIILLYYFEDLNHSAIAKRLGHAPSYIGRRRHSALRSLSKVLHDLVEVAPAARLH